MKRKKPPKVLVLLIIALFMISYFPELAIKTQDTFQTDTWVAQPLHITPLAGSASPHGYSPSQIRAAYGLPSSGGAGTTIAIIDAYHTPTIWDDLANFSSTFNLLAPSTSNFEVHQMSQSMGINSNWTEETCLDVEWTHAIAPDAKILLVEALDERSDHLLSAINYTRYRSDVVAVSLSWGTDEYPREINDDQNFFSVNGMQFFAASGDNGQSSLLWPASSPLVVAVGGTSLSLNGNTVLAETAWSKSEGGISIYESMPSYQTSYGLIGNKRSVPDVSYNADPQKGFSVYCNGTWHMMGGTSAGAPQWAAIHALGLSANNGLLYVRAKTAHSSYFRDITLGSNSNNSATVGYDLVTGLGSPITHNFAASLTVWPNSGPAQAALTLNGTGLTPNGYANISYLNPLTSKWTLTANNIAIDSSGQFKILLTAPDLLQNSPVGDNQPSFNNIVFQVKDNNSGRTYNSTGPYTEMRRGLTQIASQTALGLYGNNTNLAATGFVQNGQAITVSGSWFSPTMGIVELFWDDNSSLGTSTVDATGEFIATLTIPTSTLGQHRITVNDGTSNFCINITRSPLIANDYITAWHTSDITVNLTNETYVSETYYSINNGPTLNVSTNGQPIITTESGANTLEYWSTWNINGILTALPHTLVTNIQLEKPPPLCSMQINGGSTQAIQPSVTLTLIANSMSGVTQMRFSNDGIWDTETWETFSSMRGWILTDGNGAKTVYCQLKDNAGLISTIASSISLSTSQTTPTPTPAPTSQPTSNPTSTPTLTATPTFEQPQVTPDVPESNIQMILVLLSLVIFAFLVVYKRQPTKVFLS